jgi:erythromycin esterase-like protein
VLAGIEQCAGVSYPNADAYYGSPEVAALEGGAPPDAAKHAGCLATLEVLGTYLDTHADELVAASSEAALRWAKISLIGLEAFEGTMYYYNDDEAKSYELRDAGNAYVIQELRELMFPGARVAVWAHKVHIAADSEAMHVSEYAPNSVATPTGWKSMGTRLEEQLGADYVAIGISAYRVQVSWGGDYDLPVPVASESIERLLHTLGHERLLVDLRPQVSSFPPGDEFQLFWQWLVPGDQFDGLLYMDASAGMTYVE